MPATIPDTPYVETISTRFLSQGDIPVEGWGRLPFSGPVAQVAVSGSSATPTFHVVAQTTGQVYAATAAVTRSSSTPGMTDPTPSNWTYPLTWRTLSGWTINPATDKIVTRFVLATVSPKGVQLVSCNDSSCKPGSVLASPFSLGNIRSVASDTVSTTMWIGCDAGLVRYFGPDTFTMLLNASSADVGGGLDAVAYSPTAHEVSAGNTYHLWFFNTQAPNDEPWWEWVTDVYYGAGGPVADNVTALVYDDDSQALFIGTPSAMNVRYANGSIIRVDGLSGLPYANITSLAVQTVTTPSPATILHVGTDAGLSSTTIAIDAPPSQWSWRYRYLQRYLPGPRVVGVAAMGGFVGVATGADNGLAPTVTGLSGNGFALLERQMWTLEDKDTRFRGMQARHDRHALVSDCTLPTFGNMTGCENHSSDNNGLWTSIVVGAEALRYSVTKDADAATQAWHWYTGMRLLNRITGIKGLIGRSAISPTETHPAGGLWTPSTVPAYKGWTWKADASSDEVVGHTFAFTMATQLLTGTSGAGSDGGNTEEAADLLLDLADYIVSNNFQLIDFTGRHTRWGVWTPSFLNTNRTWSDERGVNSLEILALIASAIGAEPSGTSDPARVSRLLGGWNTLVNETTNRYLHNLQNLKINTPCDDNYSDDELTFLPYYSWLGAGLAPTGTGVVGDGTEAGLVSLSRTFRAVASLRSDLWGAITAGIQAQQAAAHPDVALVFDETYEDVVWNLRTWPMDLTQWPVMNSHRQDIKLNPYAGRFGNTGTDALRILPANERPQGRWNSNPHDLDGGNGMSETDGGVWMLPYWMARAAGVVGGKQ